MVNPGRPTRSYSLPCLSGQLGSFFRIGSQGAATIIQTWRGDPSGLGHPLHPIGNLNPIPFPFILLQLPPARRTILHIRKVGTSYRRAVHYLPTHPQEIPPWVLGREINVGFGVTQQEEVQQPHPEHFPNFNSLARWCLVHSAFLTRDRQQAQPSPTYFITDRAGPQGLKATEKKNRKNQTMRRDQKGDAGLL